MPDMSAMRRALILLTLLGCHREPVDPPFLVLCADSGVVGNLPPCKKPSVVR